MARAWWLVVLAGCDGVFGFHQVGTPVDAPPGCMSFSTLIDTCALPPVEMWSPGITLSADSTYSTSSHMLNGAPATYALVTLPAGSLDVLLARTFTLTAGFSLQVNGASNGNSLAIVADGAIEIDGRIVAANGGAGSRGPGTCHGSKPGADDPIGGGGGGGGGFAGAGGAGGAGDGSGSAQSAGGVGGQAETLPAGLIGGCRGGGGGSGDTTAGGAGGVGGFGGGAVALIGATTVTIATSGGINVGGGGGGPGHGLNGGGGGGGAGGMVWLEADTLDVFGGVAANGGGGGEGAGVGNGSPGADATLGAGPAAGGSGAATYGGDGGNGGGLASPDGVTPTDLERNGGGGGGGGVGFIVVIGRTARMITGLVSPAPMMP